MNKSSMLELAQVIANKTTFLQVARTAMKGNVVQKDMIVAGKQAVRFFDKAPDFIQSFVEGINPKKLSVKYGVKGYEGSSVTGFKIFDGDTVVAKGALGLDKTFGKEPFVQFNMRLTPKAGEASLGFKYNGNSIFGPNMSASQTLKSGKYNTHMVYGDTMRLDYVETEGFSEYMRACGVDYHFDKMEIVSAREIAENQVNSNKRMREMVGGRHVYTKEERASRKLIEESLKKRKPQKDLGLKIKKEYKGMPEQAIDAKIKTVEKLAPNTIVDRTYLQELIAKEEILPYFNSSTVKKIKELNCPKEELAERLTKIFMEEMGYKSELMTIRKADTIISNSDLLAEFQPQGGFIRISPSMAESKEVMACIMRHELDHFDLFARLAKTIGLEKFYEVLSKGNGYTKASINQKFWEAAIADAKPLTNREANKYIKAIKEYNGSSASDNFAERLKYHINGTESRAYDVQAALARSLGVDAKNKIYESVAENRCCRKIAGELDRIFGKKGNQGEKDELVLTLFFDEQIKSNTKAYNVLKIYNNILERLKSM